MSDDDNSVDAEGFYGSGRLGQGWINDTRSIGNREIEVNIDLIGQFEIGEDVRSRSLLEFYPDLLEPIEPRRGDLTERERIEGYLKPPFQSTRVGDDYDNTEFGEMVEVFAQFADTIRAIRIAMLAERHLPHARGRQLDEIGREVLVTRWEDEGDSSYRSRLMGEYRLLSSSGTIDDVLGGVSALLGIDREEIEIDEPFDATCAAFNLFIESEHVEEAPVDWEYLEDYVDRIRAAGVRGRIHRRGTFEFRPYPEDTPEDTYGDGTLGEGTIGGEGAGQDEDAEYGPERGWGAGRWTG